MFARVRGACGLIALFGVGRSARHGLRRPRAPRAGVRSRSSRFGLRSPWSTDDIEIGPDLPASARARPGRVRRLSGVDRNPSTTVCRSTGMGGTRREATCTRQAAKVCLLTVTAALAVAASALVAVPAGGQTAVSGFVAVDGGEGEYGTEPPYWSGPNGAAAMSIAPGGTISFAYPAGASMHNATFEGQQPICTQTSPTAADPGPRLPAEPSGPGWAGTCTFDTSAVYHLVCGLHPDIARRSPSATRRRRPARRRRSRRPRHRRRVPRRRQRGQRRRQARSALPRRALGSPPRSRERSCADRC